MSPLAVVALHTEADILEYPEESNDTHVKWEIDAHLHDRVELPRRPINTEACAENGKVQGWVVVMDISDSSHGDEGQVVQEPADHGVDTGIVDLVDFSLRELVVATLPADEIVGYQQEEDSERDGTAPVDKGVTEEEVLDNVVVPTAHAETDVEKRPLPGSGCQVILLVWVGYKSVVRGHHSDVEMDKVTEEGRLIRTRVAGGNCECVNTNNWQYLYIKMYSRFSFQWDSTFQCVKTSLGWFSLVQVVSICLKPH